MIKPISDADKILPLKKRSNSAKTDNIVTKKLEREDKVFLSPEALTALQIDQLVQKVKELPAVFEERVALVEQKLQQAGYLEMATENIAEQIGTLFLDNESPNIKT